MAEKSSETSSKRDSADVILQKRDERDVEISVFYLDQRKYGYPGSDGTWISNYVQAAKNNCEILALFFADPRNPYNKIRRGFVLFNKLSLSFMLTSIFLAADYKSIQDDDGMDSETNSTYRSVIIFLILAPYGMILDFLAKDELCARGNCCFSASRLFSFCMLYILSIPSVVYFIIGMVLIFEYLPHPENFVRTFLLSFALDQGLYFYFGIWNWILLSWGGFLFLPLFPSPCPSLCFSQGWPPKFFSLLTIFPVKFLLNLYGLGETTYEEDKLEFQKEFPGRITITDPPLPSSSSSPRSTSTSSPLSTPNESSHLDSSNKV